MAPHRPVAACDNGRGDLQLDDISQGQAADAGHDGLPQSAKRSEVVSTHVLVSEGEVQKLKELARRTRIHQSDYLREAVDDLLSKYGKLEEPKE